MGLSAAKKRVCTLEVGGCVLEPFEVCSKLADSLSIELVGGEDMATAKIRKSAAL